MTSARRWNPLGGVALLALLGSCAGNPVAPLRELYGRGEYQAARDGLIELRRSDTGNAHVYALDQSVAELAMGRPSDAEQTLRYARDRLDDLAGKSVGEWLGAVLLDDRQLDYEGADFEQVIVRALLAVANLAAGGGDAPAYALQVLERQRQLIREFADQGEDNPKDDYKLVAFGSWLRGILAEDDPLKLGTAGEAFERVVAIEPSFALGHEALERVTSGRHSAPAHGVVHVIALVGRGPFRVASEERVTQEVLAIAQVIWASLRDRVTFPNIAAVEIPALAFHQDNPSDVQVEVDGTPLGATAIVTDVEATARREFAAMRDWIVARAALRRAFKISITEGLKEAINRPEREADETRGRRGRGRRGNRSRNERQADPLVDLGISLGGLLWTALEQADLRCWGLLPASFQVMRIEVPTGEHTITLRAGRAGSSVGAAQSVRVLVRDGFNTYVIGLVPTLQGGPPPMTNEPLLPPQSL